MKLIFTANTDPCKIIKTIFCPVWTELFYLKINLISKESRTEPKYVKTPHSPTNVLLLRP